MTETHPEKRLIGYARVSTVSQTLDSQLEQLRAAGCSNRNIYREKVTDAHSDRRELLRMLNHLVPGDVVTVTRIDRLARSTFDLFGTVKLSSLSRPRATVARRSSCGSNPTDVGPHRKRTPPCSSILTGGDVAAAKVEQIIDPVMGGEEALGLTG